MNARMDELCAELDAHFAGAQARMVDQLRQLRDQRPEVFANAPAMVALDDEASPEAKERVYGYLRQAAGECS